MSYSKFRRIFK